MPGFGDSPVIDAGGARRPRAGDRRRARPRPPARRRQLARRLGRARARAGRSRALGDRDRARRPVGAAAAAQARDRAPARPRGCVPLLPALLRSERGRRIALAGTTAHPERIPSDAALQLVRAYAEAPGFEAANAAMRAGRFTGLEEIDVPLTLAWPEHDRLVGRPRTVPAGRARVPACAGCGHMPTWDDPEQVARRAAGGVVQPLGDDRVDRHRAAGAGDRHAVMAVARPRSRRRPGPPDRRQAGSGVLGDPHAQPALAHPRRRAGTRCRTRARGRARACR